VVADVYRADKEGRRPSERQLRQECAELRLYCQRWDSPDGLLTMTFAAHNRHPERKRVVCQAAIRWELVRDAHPQAHVGVQRVLTKLQLRWYWPNMGRDVRHKVRQCEICQVNKHGRLPGEAGWRRLYAGRPRQVEAVNLVKPMPTTPKENSGENPLLLEPRRQTTMRGQRRHGPGYKVVMPRAKDLARQERPLPSTEVCPLPPAPSLMPPLPDVDPEVQKPPGGGALSRDIKEGATVTSRPEAPPVKHNGPLVSKPPPSVTTPPVQSTRQPPEHLKDLVCDCAISGKYRNPARCRTGRLAKKRWSCEHHENINFCLGGIMNEIHLPETKSPNNVSQPRCSLFSYADAVKSRRAKKQ